MNVLSLFDGISCGQIALERAKIKINNYFASEIDKHAIVVTQHNYPNTVQLGDVVGIEKKLPPVDLLIGGSPCQGFSFAGKQLNFTDLRSKLFFEFVRLLNIYKPKYFLLENVNMKLEYQNIISSYLGVKPIVINSKDFSKQNRKRLYWTNIKIPPIIKKDNLFFNAYLYRLGHGYVKDEIKFFLKYPTLCAQSPGTKYRIVSDLAKAQTAIFKGEFLSLRKGTSVTRVATAEECEEFQTLPLGYTNCLQKSERYKHIGNGWTVDVIAHIFNGIIL